MSTAEYPDGTVHLLHLDPPYKHARHYTPPHPATCTPGWQPTRPAPAPGSWK
jgi:hypothetical protein